MKRYARYISISAFLLMCLLASGCGDDSNPVNGQVPFTGLSSAVIKGQVPAGFANLTVNYLQDDVIPYNHISSCIIDQKGNFNITVGEPSAAFSLDIDEFINPGVRSWQGDLFISDTTARFITGSLFIYEGNSTYGIIWHKKPDVKIHNISATYYENIYYYFTKDVEMKGRIKYGDSNNIVYTFDFKAKAGWNVLLRSSYYSYTHNEMRISFSNFIPSGSEYYECKHIGTIGTN